MQFVLQTDCMCTSPAATWDETEVKQFNVLVTFISTDNNIEQCSIAIGLLALNASAEHDAKLN